MKKWRRLNALKIRRLWPALLVLSLPQASLASDRALGLAGDGPHQGTILQSSTDEGFFTLPVVEQAKVYLKRNCNTCHEFDSSGMPDLASFGMTGGLTNSDGDGRLTGWTSRTYMAIEDVLRDGFDNPANDRIREEGVYLVRMLSKQYAEANPPASKEQTWADKLANFSASLLALVGLSKEPFEKAAVGDSHAAIAFKQLETSASFFGLDELRAAQGVEFVDTHSYVFATGYNFSVALQEKERLMTLKVMNEAQGEPELMSDVAVDETGRIYSTGYRLGDVFRYDSDLNKGAVISSGYEYPLGIDYFDGHIYLAAGAEHSITKLRLDGTKIWSKLISDSRGNRFHEPYGVTVDEQNGDVFVSFNREESLVKINAAGEFVTSVGPRLPDGSLMENIQGVSIDAHGNIYLIDTGNLRILAFDRNLRLTTVLVHPNIDSFRGLAANDRGELLVSGFTKDAPSTTEDNAGVWLFQVPQVD